MNAIPPLEQRRLNSMDWQVVEMARDDGPNSLDPDGIVPRIARILFAVHFPQRLANDELEALRRFAVRAWFFDSVRASDLEAFLDAGYSRANAQRILAYVAHHREFVPPFHQLAA